MLTRRAVLTGTAAASIAAIANARGVEAAPSEGFGGCGFGNLAGGAAGVLQKDERSYIAFFKFRETAAEVVFQQTSLDKVDVFFKVFVKGWSPWVKEPVPALSILDKGQAYFSKLGEDSAEFFVKGPDDLGVFAKVESNVDGLSVTFVPVEDNS